MFINLYTVVDGRDSILAVMAVSEYKYTLTGSRFFGMSNEMSDYDFYCMDERGVERELSGLGFQRLFGSGSAYHDDPSVHYVMRHQSGIDVQIIKPRFYQLKDRVNRYLNTPFGRQLLTSFPTKEDRRQLWKFLMNFGNV